MTHQTKLIKRNFLLGGAGVAALAMILSTFVFDEAAPIHANHLSLHQDNKISQLEAKPLASNLAEGAQLISTLAYESRLGALPDSLQGTQMQQSLQVDEQGNLRISSDIKRVFDYFLSTIEEEELDVVLARIDEYLSYYLQEPALTQSKQILAQYISLKQALYDYELSRSESIKGMMENGELMADKGRYVALLSEQLNALSEMRAQYLDAEVYEAFYASEEAYDQYTLARLSIDAEKGLSAEEKEQRLAQVDAQAPADIIESRREARITDELNSRVAQIKEEGGGYEEVRAVRVEMFGVEAAERFDTLDQERAQWQARIDSFLDQRQEILLIEGLSAEERQAQVDTLRASQFDSREQIRVKVYERKADV
ncbi:MULTISPECIES: lipase secretion chaperone [unclassified Oleiphilus]|uniref:lipase secretion chaperone n=3 Tax=Oleiphilus TaxID=141450 RepID=UPI0007C2B38A|nr:MULTISPECIES: lipase secretion chaperone [unclassified Oleiphilus]KZY40234.1 hypothetical protein A3732_03920 [Oleiphilus sp. HI0050]KZZ35826.1 hypothetical protein A3756_14625 [Oleiphilus sp. HI0086]KZZ37349.1 hypothetical protein A3757_11660 [Oleiphilus sp. HI0117]KZZ57468.1 hypothetical protein A3761_00070 [Oleiphilus sp. HI0123]